MDHQEDILLVDFVDVGAFIPEEIPRGIPDDDPVQTALLRAAEVFAQLRQADIPVAVHDIHPAVLIEQQGGIVVDSPDILLFPGTFDAVRREEEGFRPLMGDEDRIEPAVVVPQGSRPHAVAVGGLLPFQDFPGRMLQGFIQVCADFPADEVMGSEDHSTGEEMHGRTDHVIRIADPDDIRIRVIHSREGIEAGGDLEIHIFCHIRLLLF